MGNSTESNETLNRKQAKKANKRRKMEALLRISALNDQDRQALSSTGNPPLGHDNQEESKRVLEQGKSNLRVSQVDGAEASCSSNDGPSPKRHKPDPTTKDDEEMPTHSDVLPTPPVPFNIGSLHHQHMFLPHPNGTYPQQPSHVPHHPNLGAVPSLPVCPNFFQRNLAVQVSKPQPIFPYFVNGLTPLHLVPALLVPEARNIPAILGNLRDSPSQCTAPYFNPTAITFLPTVCGYPCGHPVMLPGPNFRIPTFQNRTAPTNASSPAAENKDNIEEDLKNLRKSLSARTKRSRSPQFCLSATGEASSLSTREGDRVPIFTSDLQRLILRASNARIDLRLGRFKDLSQISGVKLLLLEGLSLKDIESSPELSALLSDTFPVQMECVMPASYEGALLEELAAFPLTSRDRANLIRKYGSLECALRSSNQIFRVLGAFFPIRQKDNKLFSRLNPAVKPCQDEPNDQGIEMSQNTDTFSRTHLLCSAWQMIEEGYPLPIKGNLFNQFEDFGMTKEEYKEVTSSSPMFGLDCEMCLTTLKKHELTRVSVINEKHEVIFDTLVKPPNKIINYLTEFSGITKEMMEGVTTTLQDVQEKLREILEPDAILVGQSLNSDLIALQLMHPYVIDTSIIFNLTGDRCRKSKLKYLAKAFLQIDIQHDAAAGHDPVEDAGTALKLVQLKLTKSLEFGDAVLSQLRGQHSMQGKPEHEIAGEKQRAAKRINAHADQSKDDDVAVSVFRYLNRKTVSIICHPNIAGEYHKYAYIVNIWGGQHSKKEKLHRPKIVEGQDEQDIVDKAVRCINQSFYTIAHVHVEQPVSELITMRDEETTERFKSIIRDFHRAAPLNSLVLLVLGGNNEGANGAVYLNIHKKTFTRTCKLSTPRTTTN